MIAQQSNIVRRLVVITMLAAGLGACSSQPTSPSATVVDQSSAASRPASLGIGNRAAAVALKQVGMPYRFGGSTPDGFDCSGLVFYSYGIAGKRIPRTTAALWQGTDPVAMHEMRAGDLLFFSFAGKMSHVGLYLGDGQFVHAPSSGKSVTVEDLGADYYRLAFVRAGRPR